MEQQNRQRFLDENQQLEYAQIKKNDEEKKTKLVEEEKLIMETLENNQGNQIYHFYYWLFNFEYLM